MYIHYYLAEKVGLHQQDVELRYLDWLHSAFNNNQLLGRRILKQYSDILTVILM